MSPTRRSASGLAPLWSRCSHTRMLGRSCGRRRGRRVLVQSDLLTWLGRFLKVFAAQLGVPTGEQQINVRRSGGDTGEESRDDHCAAREVAAGSDDGGQGRRRDRQDQRPKHRRTRHFGRDLPGRVADVTPLRCPSRALVTRDLGVTSRAGERRRRVWQLMRLARREAPCDARPTACRGSGADPYFTSTGRLVRRPKSSGAPAASRPTTR